MNCLPSLSAAPGSCDADGLTALPLDWPSGVGLRLLPGGRAVGRWRKLDLGSVFQPLIASDDGACVGHEAFVRAYGGGELELSPWTLFSRAADDEALVALDRLCRTLHVLNFREQAPDRKLFLNVHGRLLAAISEDHGHAFRRVLDGLKLHPAQFVIETPDAANVDRLLLAFVLDNYRRNEFAVATNVQGVPALENLVRVVRPDYVKLHGHHLRQPAQMRQAIRIARDNGIEPVFTRIDDEAQLEFLRAEPGVLIQGWAVGRPCGLRPAVAAASGA